MPSIYDHERGVPFHLSVGAVLVNNEGKIRAHHFEASKMLPEYRYKLGGLSEAYVLMRETIEEGESLPEAVARGLAEEFGAEGAVREYLGSLQFTVEGFEKTTAFFLVTLTKEGERHPDDEEGASTLVWETPEFLLAQMREQGRAATRADLDESKIIDAYMTYGRS